MARDHNGRSVKGFHLDFFLPQEPWSGADFFALLLFFALEILTPDLLYDRLEVEKLK